MLKNPNPNNPANIPNTENYRKFEYVVLVPSSSQPNVVHVSGLLYRNEEDFFNNSAINENCYFGSIEFNLNDAGLLEACEDFALTKFIGMQKCPVPVKLEQDTQQQHGE